MKAYIIAQLVFTDESHTEEYRAGIERLLAKHGGRRLVAAPPARKLEGDWDLPDRAVVLEFPSLEVAETYYNDPDHAPLIALRQSGTVSKLMLVEGVQ